jgi:Xaa-Pro dipeptidase
VSRPRTTRSLHTKIMNDKANLAERDSRYRRIREAMAREGMDALILAGNGSHFHRGYLRYFTDTHMWAGDALLLIPLEGEPTLCWVTYAGPGQPGEGWVSDLRRAIYPEKRMVEAMNEKGLTKGKVGIAGFRKIITAGAYQTLMSGFPDVEFVNADVMTDHVRVIKSPLEIQQMREVWQLAQSAMDRFVEIVEPGLTERQVAAEAAKVIRTGGSWDDLTVIKEDPYRGLPRDVALKCNDLVALHLEVCGPSGHWAEIDCTVAFRQPTVQELKLMDTELQALDAVCKMAVPGVRLSDMAHAWERVVEENGFELAPAARHFYFHGHGMDDIQWPWYTGQLEDNQDAVIEENMVLCYHPNRPVVPSTEWGMVVADELVITKHGAERLSGDWDHRWKLKI